MNSSSRSKGSPPKGSPLSSPIVLDNDNDSVKEKAMSDKDSTIGIRQARPRRSGDSKPGDRLSIFGATFGGTLKSRKPPPRLVRNKNKNRFLSHFRYLLLAKTLWLKKHRNSVFQDYIVPVYRNRHRNPLVVLLSPLCRLKRVLVTLMGHICMTRRTKIIRVTTPFENGTPQIPLALMFQQVLVPIHLKLRTVLPALSSRG